MKFQHKIINSDNSTNNYDLVTKKYIESHSKIMYDNKNNILKGKTLKDIGESRDGIDAATKS